MRFVKSQQALAFTPADLATQQIAEAFTQKFDAWSKRLGDAKSELRSYLDSKLGVKAKGITSRDQLQMASFGLVFDKNPGQGFMRAPSEISESVRRQNVRGEVYFPDIKHPVGAEVMKRLNAISKTAAERPMLNGIPGLRSASIDGDRLILSTASKRDGQVLILAAKSAVAPEAALNQVATRSIEQEPNAFLERVAEVARQSLEAKREPLMKPPRP